MKARLLAFLSGLRGSYWFIPAVMSAGAVVLSFATTTLDGIVGEQWLSSIDWLYANKPDGARALLSTVAGSMITVAGVTFTITISSVVYASSQFGPRLLANFMQDRGNQVTLGTFIATFLYCLLVLRTVRSADEGVFVPHIAILFGLALAVASVGVLIYFIHHSPASMHVGNVVAGVGVDLLGHIDRLFPERVGEAAAPDTPALPDGFFDEACHITAEREGYLQALAPESLLAAATASDVLLYATYRPGDFVMEGKTLVLAWPPENVTDETRAAVRAAFAWGRKRSQTQDVLFLVNELVEVAARALSPGVNDPFTAINCMDWLGGAMLRVARRDAPSALRCDDDGTPRVVAMPVTFEVFAEAACGQLRDYVSTDRNAALHLMKLLADTTAEVEVASARRVLLAHARALLRACEEAPLPPQALEEVEARFRVVARLAQHDADETVLNERHRWLGGSA